MKRLIICFAIAALLSGCGGIRSHDIADVTNAETIILKKASGQKAIHSLSFTGSGKLDGNAEITLILNGGPYKTEALSGSVSFQWGGDWYSDEAEIRYSPTSVTGGNLKLKYAFNN